MTIPERIPISRIENYFTENIGTYDGGKQFMGFLLATFAREPAGADWRQRKRWYAILHKFDEDGRHIGTDHWYSGRTADGESSVIDRARIQLQTFMSELPNIRFENVSIRLFETVIDGDVFGLMRVEGSREMVQLQPNDFIFYAPWEGEFDT